MDELPDVEAWKVEFLKPEAREVVEAMGAWIYVFRAPLNEEEKQQVEEAMKAIFEVSEAHLEEQANSLMLAVAMPIPGAVGGAKTASEEWEDMCLNYGFEYIDFSAQGTNEFGEKVGFERLKEALEANEWEDTTGPDDEFDLEHLGLEDDEDGSDGFARDEAEMTAEIFGVKAALARDEFGDEGDEFMLPNQQQMQVEDLDRLMGKLMALKESSAGLPEAERRRLAAKAVGEVMRDAAL